MLAIEEGFCKVFHFLAVEYDACFNRLLAGEAADELFAWGYLEGAVGGVFELFQHLFDDLFFGTGFEVGGRSLYDKGVFAKGFDAIAEKLHVLDEGIEQNGVGRRQLEGNGEEALLGRQGFALEGTGEAFVENAFVCGLLMDHEEAVGLCGQDVGIEKLQVAGFVCEVDVLVGEELRQ